MTEKESGKVNGHEYVDLGLSVKWATCNVGATSPEKPGNYYAWGKTEAACSDWGGRLPTADEIEELCGKRKCKCKWEWTTIGEQEGYKVTGPNGNSIFLPAAGYHDSTSSLWGAGQGHYWSASGSDPDRAYYLYFCSDDFRPGYDNDRNKIRLGNDNRSYRRLVRPVSGPVSK